MRYSDIQPSFDSNVVAQNDREVNTCLDSGTANDNEEGPPVEAIVPGAEQNFLLLAGLVEEASLLEVLFSPLALLDKVENGDEERACAVVLEGAGAHVRQLADKEVARCEENRCSHRCQYPVVPKPVLLDLFFVGSPVLPMGSVALFLQVEFIFFDSIFRCALSLRLPKKPFSLLILNRAT